MCLIAVAKSGTKKYSEFFLEAIKLASLSNTDGMGYTFKRASNPNRVWIDKGFKDVDKFIICLKNKRLKDEDELVVHLRIGNKGAKTSDMSHPFVISNDTDTILSKDCYINNNTVCHNGTFFDYSEINSQLSDTFFFVRDFLSVKEVQDLLKRDVELFKTTFKYIIKTNKLAFIFNDNTPIATLGNFITDEDYLFSNESYKKKDYSNIGGRSYYGGSCADYGDCENYRGSNWRGTNNPIPDRTIQKDINFPDVEKNETTIIKSSIDRSILLNRRGLQDVDPKIDIVTNATKILYDSKLARAFYKAFDGAIFVPREYIVTQSSESKFMPKFFNYKHFLLYCTSKSNTTYGLTVGETYKISEYDEYHGQHGISLLNDEDNWNQQYVNEDEIVKHFKVQPLGVLRMVYQDVYKLIQKYDNLSKTNYTESNKVIKKANSLNKTTGLTYKQLTNLDLEALKIYNNYLMMAIYSPDTCRQWYHIVQKAQKSILVN